MSNALEKAKAKEQIVDSIRDLYSAKITLPLGNPNLKLVHTNQMLFTELPNNVFELANFDAISKALNSSYSRFSGYTLNRWYIEAVTITNDGNTAKMELDVNPFASDVLNFRDDKRSFISAYTSATSSTSTSTSSSSTKKIKSVNSNSNTKLKNVKGFNKSDNAFIQKVVKQALSKNPKSDFKKAEAIFEYYKKNHVYSYYDCMRKIKSGGFKKAWNNKHHNCGDGAATICAMMRCAGFQADIMQKYNHFYVRVKINGKYYYCDQAGSPGSHNTRVLGSAGSNKNVWGGISKSASVVGYRYCP